VTFDDSFEKVVGIEGRYSHNPRDSGGETMYGITLRVARAYGYQGPMQAMPLATAKAIYREGYWDKLRLDQVAAVAGARVADEIFDTAVNLGAAKAGTYLQRSLNVLNQGAVMYADIPVDGDVGPLTIEALRSYCRRRGQDGNTVLLRCLNALQGAFYIDLAEKREKDETFVFGWFKNRVTFA
jgi:lysozyme family protein